MSSRPSAPALDPASQWQRFCSQLWHNEKLGFWLDVSRMGLDSATLSALKPRFDQAFQAMAALESGSIANADEQRQVGHYWLRNPQLAPDPASGAHIQAEVDRIESFGRDVLSGAIGNGSGQRFTDVLWIGIGGSGLGPLLMIRALQDPGAGLPFHFFDNVDPDGMRRTLASIGERLKTTLVIVVSKSGGTPEPHIGMLQARRAV
ncbi:MAG: glucose-6-phosphate isomerase, partial [Vulcanococcus sp.]